MIYKFLQQFSFWLVLFDLTTTPLSPPSQGNVIELWESAFLFEVKPKGLTEYSP